jgi:hypothetical protein
LFYVVLVRWSALLCTTSTSGSAACPFLNGGGLKVKDDGELRVAAMVSPWKRFRRIVGMPEKLCTQGIEERISDNDEF